MKRRQPIIYPKMESLMHKIIDPIYKNLVIDINRYFNAQGSETIFKKRNVVKIIGFNNERLVVKSFKIPHFINRIVYRFFRSSKAQRSYENSFRLTQMGINTPKPIGYIENRSLFFLNESYYISELCNYDFEIRAVFNDKTFPDRNCILEQFIEFTVDLHDKGVYHIDYSPGNILVQKQNDYYTFWIIDVNRMQFMSLNNDLRMKNLAKLTFDEEDNKQMIRSYALKSSVDIDEMFKRLEYHLQVQKNYLSNKKKMKSFKR